MDSFFNSKKFIFILAVILICSALSGCANKTVKVKDDKTPTITDTIGKMDAISSVLGCMFAPQTCDGKDNDDAEWEELEKELEEEQKQSTQDLNF